MNMIAPLARRTALLGVTWTLLIPACGGDGATTASGAGAAGEGGGQGGGGATGGSGGAGGTTGGASGTGGAGAQAGSGGSSTDPCANFGATREVTCGNCGRQQQTCASDGFWSNVNGCEGQGECLGGTAERQNEGTCEDATRLCDSACTWGEWQPTNAERCFPATTDYEAEGCAIGTLKKRTCTASCTWGEPTPCENQCSGTPRTTPDDAQEICIPAGDFVRGDDGSADSMPIANVYLSSYYLDRYPVTARRYQECIQAGACAPPSFNMTGALDYPMYGIPKAEASSFCVWDGRELQTEAQWEKAARGPAPRYTKFIWGNDAKCDSAQRQCPVLLDRGFRYDSQPAMRGYYGTEPMGGMLYEYVRDAYAADYYGTAESTVDPTGPADGVGQVMRGYHYFVTFTSIAPIGARTTASVGPVSTFRCSRPPS